MALRNYYYDKLDQNEQYAYTLLKNALMNSEASCTISRTGDSAIRVWRAVVLDTPDIIRYPGFKWNFSINGDESIFHFAYITVDAMRYQNNLERLKERIRRKISLCTSPSQYTVCKIIYDAIASTIKYDHKISQKYESIEKENPAEEIYNSFIGNESAPFTAYGCVVNQKAVCQGISRFFQLMCNDFGIECTCVHARERTKKDNEDEKKGEPLHMGKPDHMLNCVEIDGVRAFVDITQGLLKEGYIIGYDYFLVPYRIYKRLFIVEEAFGCESEEISYHARNGLTFKNINMLRRYLCSYVKASTGGEVRCHYDGEDYSDEDLDTLVKEILEEHCEALYYTQGGTRKGFFNGIITSEDNN